MLIIELICPNENSEKPFWKKICFGAEKQNFTMTMKDWKNLAESFNNCPHPLNGKTVRTAFTGTNPYLYTGLENDVVYDEKGIPLGSNGGIMHSLSRVFGFNLDVQIYPSGFIWDNQTGKFVNIPGQVTTIYIF